MKPLRYVFGGIPHDRADAEGYTAVAGTVAINPKMAWNSIINRTGASSMKHRFVSSGEHDHVPMTVFQMLLLGFKRRFAEGRERSVDCVGGSLARRQLEVSADDAIKAGRNLRHGGDIRASPFSVKPKPQKILQ